MNAKRCSTMAEAVDDLKQRGFTANFEFLNQAFRDVNSGRIFNADDLTIVEHYRFEGTSDPDDMSVIYAIQSHEGTAGLIVDAFGTYADPSLGRFLEKVSYSRTMNQIRAEFAGAWRESVHLLPTRRSYELTA